jgi:hypothetical protein
MSRFDDDEDVMGGFRSHGDAVAHADDPVTFDAARVLIRAGIPSAPPVATAELATLLTAGAFRRSRMNPLAKIAGLGLAGKLALASGLALAASAGGLTVANVATSGHGHAAAGLAKASSAISSSHGASPIGSDHPAIDPTASGAPTNHGTCVSAAAQSTPTPSASPNAHGQAVAGVAQSDCDKPAQAGGGEPTALPTQANSHASDHPTGEPSTVPSSDQTGNPGSSHPSGPPSSVPPTR